MKKRKRKSKIGILKWFGPSFILAILGFIVAYQFVEPAPPRTLTLAAGAEDGAYFSYALAYRHALSRSGIDVKILKTAGTTENLALLSSTNSVDIAFIQSGVANLALHSNLTAIASLYFEPLWIFYRAEEDLDQIRQLKEMRVAIGAEGSGTRALALRLLEDNGISLEQATLEPLSGNAAADALEKGKVDAAMFVASPHTELVTWLLRNPEIKLMSVSRADGLQKRHNYLSKQTLLEGVIDPAQNIPSKNHTLLSPAATLVAKDDFHPALVDLFLDVASGIHGTGDWLEEIAEFPSPLYVDFPLSDISADFFKNGRPFLKRVLPFWAANLINRLKIMLIPLLTLAIPLIKLAPRVYQWRIRRRINRWYQALQKLETVEAPGKEKERISEILAEIERIESEVAKVKVPASYGDNLYQLRFHTSLARKNLDELKKKS